jgi:type IV pilus assembly protein PilY1
VAADADATQRDAIINWVRGQDNIDDENINGSTTDIRASVHGDVLHSRPAVINYNRLKNLITGTDADSTLQRDSDIYVFYGTNGGMLHAVKGGALQKSDGAGGTTALTVSVGPDAGVLPGTERWSFVAREFFPNYKRLRAQTPQISGTKPKDYFFDGSIGIYINDVPGTGNAASPGAGTVTGVIGDNAGDKVYLYTTMRRGGLFLYAFDVTNPTAPKLLWKKGSTDTNWGELGRTFSEPKVARVLADIGNPSNPDNVVLIFGGGYQRSVEDINPCLLQSSSLTNVVQAAIGTGTINYTASGSCTVTNPTGSATTFTRSIGRVIMVVDAFNGNVIWQAGGALTTSSAGLTAPAARKLNVPDMTCAIPSDTTVLDKNRDGFADRVYTGDTCGQVWRADISNPNMDEWTVTKIAALASTTPTDIANKRKFLFPSDLVFATDATGNYTAVLLGSGDREHPFDTTVVNRFYMLKDRDSSDPGNPQAGATNATSVKISGFGTPPTGAALTDSDLFDATNATLTSDPLGLNGWMITLAGGEKVVSSATTIAGTTFFNTNQPSSSAGGGACGSNLGIAREYLVGFADAAATVDLNGTGGTTITDRSTIHAGGGYLPSPVPVVVEIDGKKYQAVISGTSVQTPPGLTLEKRTRAFWYKQID